MEAGQKDDPGKLRAPGYFVGSYTHSLDPKKRLTIPSEWRETVSDPSQLYVLPGLNERCLYVFPAHEMAQRLESIRSSSITDGKARLFSRLLGMSSGLMTWDAQGRIRIPDELLDYARLIDQVMLVGALKRFELWSPAVWKESGFSAEASLGDVAGYVGF